MMTHRLRGEKVNGWWKKQQPDWTGSAGAINAENKICPSNEHLSAQLYMQIPAISIAQASEFCKTSVPLEQHYCEHGGASNNWKQSQSSIQGSIQSCVGCLQPIPAVCGQRQGCTLDISPVHWSPDTLAPDDYRTPLGVARWMTNSVNDLGLDPRGKMILLKSPFNNHINILLFSTSSYLPLQQ